MAKRQKAEAEERSRNGEKPSRRINYDFVAFPHFDKPKEVRDEEQASKWPDWMRYPSLLPRKPPPMRKWRPE